MRVADRLLWDISDPANDPTTAARVLCADLALPAAAVNEVSHAIAAAAADARRELWKSTTRPETRGGPITRRLEGIEEWTPRIGTHDGPLALVVPVPAELPKASSLKEERLPATPAGGAAAEKWQGEPPRACARQPGSLPLAPSVTGWTPDSLGGSATRPAHAEASAKRGGRNRSSGAGESDADASWGIGHGDGGDGGGSGGVGLGGLHALAWQGTPAEGRAPGPLMSGGMFRLAGGAEGQRLQQQGFDRAANRGDMHSGAWRQDVVGVVEPMGGLGANTGHQQHLHRPYHFHPHQQGPNAQHFPAAAAAAASNVSASAAWMVN